jgi:hypothetical protein
MKRLAALSLALAFTVGLPQEASAGPITFDLLPANGAIVGQAGSTIGWGYTVTNGSEHWLELTSVSADPFEHATGDASPFDFAILAPGQTHTAIYDAAVGFPGLFQLTWDLSAPVGFTNIGVFVVTGMLWNASPFDSAAAVIALAPDLTAAYSASVTPVPEPGTLLLMGSGAAMAALARRRRSRCLSSRVSTHR